MLKIIDVPIQKLREHENNPRNNALSVDKVKASIERLGFMFPAIIDMNYVLVCGHTRYLACKALGHQTMPCIMADNLTPEQVDLFRYVDNKTSEYATWDYEKLAQELGKIDSSLAPNSFIVESFDFDLEPAEFNVVPTSVPVSTFNFMGNDYKKPERNKSESSVEEIPDDDEDWEDDTGEDSEDESNIGGERSGKRLGSGEAVVFGDDAKSKPPVIHLFRCASRRFIISEIEEERLVAVYTKYMGEVYPNSTFLQYLLGGKQNVEVQSESAD